MGNNNDQYGKPQKDSMNVPPNKQQNQPGSNPQTPRKDDDPSKRSTSTSTDYSKNK